MDKELLLPALNAADLSAGVAGPHANNEPPRPVFIRLPAARERCQWTGFSRSGLNELILPTESNRWKPPVRSISKRKRGALRGTRLVDFDSLISYLRGLAQEGGNQ